MEAIKKIQIQIKKEMSCPLNKDFDGTSIFNIGIVDEAFTEVETVLICEKEHLKNKRPIIKLLSKHNSKYSLKEHDEKMKKINKELRKMKKLDRTDFLINGKFFL